MRSGTDRSQLAFAFSFSSHFRFVVGSFRVVHFNNALSRIVAAYAAATFALRLQVHILQTHRMSTGWVCSAFEGVTPSAALHPHMRVIASHVANGISEGITLHHSMSLAHYHERHR
jgi:hypothetical protein